MAMHDGHRDRMREKIRNEGLAALSPHEALEYFLFAFVPRRNTNDIAHRLLQQFGSLSGVLSADYNALCQVEGMTANAALFLCNLPQLAVMYKRDLVQHRAQPLSAQDGAAYLNDLIGTLPYECFAVLCCDVKGNRLGCLQYTVENRDFVSVNMRKFVKDVLLLRANNVIVAHNHPSGDVRPSEQDYAMYQALETALHPLGIELVDCLIVSGDNVFSFAQHHVAEGNRPHRFAESSACYTGEDLSVLADEVDEYDLLFNRDDAPKRKK